MSDVWSQLAKGEGSLAYNELVLPHKIGIRNHLVYCRDKGLTKSCTFYITPDGMTSDKSNNKKVAVEIDNDEVLDVSKQWIKRMIAGFGICPFTIDENNT